MCLSECARERGREERREREREIQSEGERELVLYRLAVQRK